MAELTGGELCARVLREAGVGHVFTLWGGHILPIYDGCLTEGVRIIDVRHEQVWCINVPLDPTAYRRGGQVSMAI